MGMSSKRKSIPVWGGDKPTHFRLLPSVVPKEPELVTRLQPKRGVQEEKRLWRPGPHPSCLSFSHNKGTEFTQHEQPRSDATVNIQLARAQPHEGTGAPKNNSKQQIRHNQHAATHTVQFFLQTRFNESIKTGAQTKRNRQGLKRAGGGSPAEVGGSAQSCLPHTSQLSQRLGRSC